MPFWTSLSEAGVATTKTELGTGGLDCGGRRGAAHPLESGAETISR